MRYIKRTVLLLCTLSSCTALAESEVWIEVVNLSKETIRLTPISKNDRNTLLQTPARPDTEIKSGESTFFSVPAFQTQASFASVHYGTRSKSCAFLTTYVNARQWGTYVPRWNHSAKASGGARCSSRLVSTDRASHDWSVQFTFH